MIFLSFSFYHLCRHWNDLFLPFPDICHHWHDLSPSFVAIDMGYHRNHPRDFLFHPHHEKHLTMTKRIKSGVPQLVMSGCPINFMLASTWIVIAIIIITFSPWKTPHHDQEWSSPPIGGEWLPMFLSAVRALKGAGERRREGGREGGWERERMVECLQHGPAQPVLRLSQHHSQSRVHRENERGRRVVEKERGAERVVECLQQGPAPSDLLSFPRLLHNWHGFLFPHHLCHWQKERLLIIFLSPQLAKD